MTTADPCATAHFLGAFFDELTRWGVRDVVVSPGSRSTPLSMVAFELSHRAPERLRLFVDVDERGAAFLALGMAKASGRPAAVVCTSGSAVANYYPAVMEAESSRVPLVVLTGDRPPQLQGLGAPQTCDQLHAFGSHVRAFRAMPLPAGDADSLAFARQAAREAFIAACGSGVLPAGGTLAVGGGCVPGGGEVSPAAASMRISGACFGGPVHLNFPFDEPLKPAVDLDDLFEGGRATQVGAIAAPTGLLQANASIDAITRVRLADLLANGALLLAGEGSCATQAEASCVLAFARKFSLPVLADPLSGLRSFNDPRIIANYDSVLGKGGTSPSEALSAQVIVRFGRYPISKKATQWARRLTQAGAAEVVVDPLETRDTNAATSLFVRMRPVDFVRAMVADAAVGAASKACSFEAIASTAGQAELLAAWQAADAAAERRIVSVADGAQPAGVAGSVKVASSVETSASARVHAPADAPTAPDTFEGAYVRRVLELAPAGSCLFAANSMSVRAVDTFLTRSNKRLCVLANRGLNGIDGTVSTAIGAAQHFDRTTFITGDLTMLHDLNALALQRELRVQAALSPEPAGTPARGITIVLLNNNGGAIFDMLPQKSQDAYFERLFLTPQDVDFAQAAAAFGVPYVKAPSIKAFDQAYQESLDVAGINLIEIPVPLSGVTQRYGAYW